ncbi:MAG: hypothetical protein HOU81_15610 [Hamadaea sp.]|uniref:serine hydrolase n=1 Tax=Hamadaea sp. TaxID=2024425 RepID=UPI0017C04F7A|nr:serine hydrolase [Hamadaea sp.]NUR72240.1 hypothetical protein [Hamadaea sp.]NUT17671.1 hypothetical protein [Hamadaea sp.]
MQSRKPLFFAVGAASLAAVAALGVGVATAHKPSSRADVSSTTPSSTSSASPSSASGSSSSSPSNSADGAPAGGAAAVDTAAIEKALLAYIDTRGGDAAIAVYDRKTGTSVSVNGSDEFQTASIVKVDIIAALMLQRQADGESLSSQEKAWAKAAITASDNDAATSLFQAIGGRSGLVAANKTLGLTETTPSSSWGMTTTTVDDQVRLMSTISDANGPLSAANRALLQGWMANVIDEQRFGVTAGATSDAIAVYVKVGWVDLDDEGGLYAANSIGRIVEDDHDWVIAVLSDHNRNLSTGKTLVDGTVTKAMSLLRASDG